MSKSELDNPTHKKIMLALFLLLISGIAGVLIDADHLPYVFGLYDDGRPLHKPAFVLSVFLLTYHSIRFGYSYYKCHNNN